MLTITTKTTLILLWKYHPSFIADGVLLTRCSHIWKHWTTEIIVFTIGSVDSFTIVYWIVELLAVDVVVCIIYNEGLVECNVVW